MLIAESIPGETLTWVEHTAGEVAVTSITCCENYDRVVNLWPQCQHAQLGKLILNHAGRVLIGSVEVPHLAA
jgi:hypothetical protein